MNLRGNEKHKHNTIESSSNEAISVCRRVEAYIETVKLFVLEIKFESRIMEPVKQKLKYTIKRRFAKEALHHVCRNGSLHRDH